MFRGKYRYMIFRIKVYKMLKYNLQNQLAYPANDHFNTVLIKIRE